MFEMLHYKGDLTLVAEPGMLLGEDEFGRPFQIIDSEYDSESNLTTVHLEYAN